MHFKAYAASSMLTCTIYDAQRKAIDKRYLKCTLRREHSHPAIAALMARPDTAAR